VLKFEKASQRRESNVYGRNKTRSSILHIIRDIIQRDQRGRDIGEIRENTGITNAGDYWRA
jgi:hypothetical protein